MPYQVRILLEMIMIHIIFCIIVNANKLYIKYKFGQGVIFWVQFGDFLLLHVLSCIDRNPTVEYYEAHI